MTPPEELEFEEFLRWRRHRSSPLEEAFRQLHEVIDNPKSGQVDGVLSVTAFNVLARCLVEIKKKLEA